MAVLGDLVRLTKRQVDPVDHPNLPYVGLEHIEPGVPEVRGPGQAADAASSKFLFQQGDILFAKIRPYLNKVAQARFSGMTSTDALVLRPRDGIDPAYAYYALAAPTTVAYAVRTSTGTKMPRADWSAMEDLDVPLPPLEEQRRVAELLTSIDESKRSNAAMPGEARMLQILESLFDSLRVPFKPLGELLTQPPKNGIYKKPVDEGRPATRGLVRMQDVFLSRYLMTPDPVWVQPTGKEAEVHQLKLGDVLLARRSLNVEGAGLSTLVTPRHVGWFPESSLIRLRVDKTKIDPELLVAYLHSPTGRAEMRRRVRQVAVSGVTGTDILDIPVPMPGIERQAELLEFVRTFGKALRVRSEISDQLDVVKKGMLEALMAPGRATQAVEVSL